MAVDMFIKIGDVEGESADKSHGKEIDVLAWSWGMSQSGNMHQGGGGGAGKVSVADQVRRQVQPQPDDGLLQR